MSELDMSPFERREICCPECDGRGYLEEYTKDEEGLPAVTRHTCHICRGIGMYSDQELLALERRL